ADGTYTFNPGPDFQNLAKDATAETSITYTVSDGEGGTSSATLTITVTGTNDAPTLTPNVTLDDQANDDGEAITPVDISGQFADSIPAIPDLHRRRPAPGPDPGSGHRHHLRHAG
ncbi:hypothetical protein AZ14_1130, partial [Bordetella bronchiseptica 980]